MVENKWLSFKIGNQKVILGGIYRHPHRDIDPFNNALKNALENISGNDIGIIMGDFNINLLEENDAKINCYISRYTYTAVLKYNSQPLHFALTAAEIRRANSPPRQKVLFPPPSSHQCLRGVPLATAANV